MNQSRTNRVISSTLLGLALVIGLAGIGRPGQAIAQTSMGWKYTALGDSNARGLGAFKGYVPRFRDYIRADTGVSTTLTNLSFPAWTSSRLAQALTKPTDPYIRSFRNTLTA